MKRLEINQMEETNGGYDYALESRLARIAKWSLGAAYDVYKCNY